MRTVLRHIEEIPTEIKDGFVIDVRFDSNNGVFRRYHMKYTEEELDQYIELFFFDPSKNKDTYKKSCMTMGCSNVFCEKGCLFSPLYLVLRDIRFCFGVGKEFNSIRDDLEFPDRAGILLIDIAFRNLIKKIFKHDFDEFAQKYMELTSDNLKGIRNLRNALEHNFYGLSFYDKDDRCHYYYSLSYNYKLIQEIRKQPCEKFITYGVNPRKLYSSFENGIILFKQILLKHSNPDRKYFRSSLDLKSWIIYKN
jgi:hypothetical protein